MVYITFGFSLFLQYPNSTLEICSFQAMLFNHSNFQVCGLQIQNSTINMAIDSNSGTWRPHTWKFWRLVQRTMTNEVIITKYYDYEEVPIYGIKIINYQAMIRLCIVNCSMVMYGTAIETLEKLTCYWLNIFKLMSCLSNRNETWIYFFSFHSLTCYHGHSLKEVYFIFGNCHQEAFANW